MGDSPAGLPLTDAEGNLMFPNDPAKATEEIERRKNPPTSGTQASRGRPSIKRAFDSNMARQLKKLPENIVVINERVQLNEDNFTPVEGGNVGFSAKYFPDNTKTPNELNRARLVFAKVFKPGVLNLENPQPPCDLNDYGILREGLMNRLVSIRNEVYRSRENQGESTSVRGLQEQGERIRKLLDDIDGRPCNESSDLKSDESYSFGKEKIQTLNDDKIHVLIRNFAFLVLQALNPVEGFDDMMEIDPVDFINIVDNPKLTPGVMKSFLDKYQELDYKVPSLIARILSDNTTQDAMLGSMVENEKKGIRDRILSLLEGESGVTELKARLTGDIGEQIIEIIKWIIDKLTDCRKSSTESAEKIKSLNIEKGTLEERLRNLERELAAAKTASAPAAGAAAAVAGATVIGAAAGAAAATPGARPSRKRARPATPDAGTPPSGTPPSGTPPSGTPPSGGLAPGSGGAPDPAAEAAAAALATNIARIATLEEQLRKISAELDQCKRSHETLTAENTRLSGRLVELQAQLATSVAENGALKTENERLKTDKGLVDDQLKAVNDQLKLVNDQLIKANADLAKARADALANTSASDAVKLRLAENIATIAAKEAEIKTHKDALEAQKTEYEKQKRELEERSNKITALEADLVNAKKFESELATANETNKGLIAERNAYTDRIKALQEQITNSGGSSAEIARLKAELETLKANRDAAIAAKDAELDTFRESNGNLTAQLAAAAAADAAAGAAARTGSAAAADANKQHRKKLLEIVKKLVYGEDIDVDKEDDIEDKAAFKELLKRFKENKPDNSIDLCYLNYFVGFFMRDLRMEDEIKKKFQDNVEAVPADKLIDILQEIFTKLRSDENNKVDSDTNSPMYMFFTTDSNNIKIESGLEKSYEQGFAEFYKSKKNVVHTFPPLGIQRIGATDKKISHLTLFTYFLFFARRYLMTNEAKLTSNKCAIHAFVTSGPRPPAAASAASPTPAPGSAEANVTVATTVATPSPEAAAAAAAGADAARAGADVAAAAAVTPSPASAAAAADAAAAAADAAAAAADASSGAPGDSSAAVSAETASASAAAAAASASTVTPEITTTAAPEITTTAAPEITTTAAPEITTTAAQELTTTAAQELTTTAAPTSSDPDADKRGKPVVSPTDLIGGKIATGADQPNERKNIPLYDNSQTLGGILYLLYHGGSGAITSIPGRIKKDIDIVLTKTTLEKAPIIQFVKHYRLYSTLFPITKKDYFKDYTSLNDSNITDNQTKFADVFKIIYEKSNFPDTAKFVKTFVLDLFKSYVKQYRIMGDLDTDLEHKAKGFINIFRDFIGLAPNIQGTKTVYDLTGLTDDIMISEVKNPVSWIRTTTLHTPI